MEVVHVLGDETETDVCSFQALLELGQGEVSGVGLRLCQSLTPLLVEAPHEGGLARPRVWARHLLHATTLPEPTAATEGRMSGVS